VKNVDPADSSSPEVVQIESAMGAAIEVFAGATAIGVGRERFLPVKTTNDLMLLRSDVYDVTGEGRLDRVADPAPLVDLDPRYYKTISKFDSRFPDGVPSLREADSLTVEGDWTFERDVRVTGAARLDDAGEPGTVSSGTVLDG
jgi:UTP--glucose-1-phosphate uridylyltransferase